MCVTELSCCNRTGARAGGQGGAARKTGTTTGLPPACCRPSKQRSLHLHEAAACIPLQQPTAKLNCMQNCRISRGKQVGAHDTSKLFSWAWQGQALGAGPAAALLLTRGTQSPQPSGQCSRKTCRVRSRRGAARQGQGAMKSRLVLVTAPAVVVMGATLKKSRHSARPLSKCSSGAAAAASSSSSNAPESAAGGRQWMRVGQAGRQASSRAVPRWLSWTG